MFPLRCAHCRDYVSLGFPNAELAALTVHPSAVGYAIYIGCCGCGFVKWGCGLVARMVGNFSDVLVVVVGMVFWAVGVLMVALGLVVLVAAFGRRHGFHVVG